MGKPGGFFKRLKAKQKRSASRQRRGTKGASKEERRRKREEKATYFAARREAEQLAAISSSSDDEENDDNVHTHAPRGRRNGGRDGEEELSDGAEGAALRAGERKLRRLRALLGVHTEGQKRPRHHHHRRHHRNHNESSTKAQDDGASDDEGSVFAASSEEDDDDTASLPFADTDSEASEEAEEDVSDDDGDVRHEEDEGDEDEDDEDGLLIEDDAEEEEGLGEDNPLLALDENEDEDDAADLFAQVEAEGKNNNNHEEEEANDEEDEEEEEQSEKEDAYFDEDEDSDAEEGEEESTRHNKKREKKAAAQAAAPSSAEDGEGVLLEKFVLGTSSLRTIVQSTKIDAEDNWLRKYHCDEHGEVDETPLVPLPLSELATRQLQHSNDVLIERAARTAEQEQGRHTSSTAQDPFAVHAEDYGTVHPENVTIAATAHARAHLLHPPFELPEDSTTGQVPQPSQSMKKTTTMGAESEEAMKGSAVCEERPSYMHEVLWQKWVAFRAQTQRPVFTNEERGLLDLLQGYADLMDCLRCWQNGQSRREIYVLHMLNHWFKARAVVMAHEKILQTQRARRREQQKQEKEEVSKHTNNTKKTKGTKDGSENARKAKTAWVDAEDFELRDRGFGRTRLLVMLPMRNIAYRYVETLVAILGAAPAQCPKLELFRSDFSEVAEAVDRLFGRRAMDYQRQFEGNIDDAFCVGLRLEPQRVHVYAHPLNSDIILCSPLGLRRRLEKAADIVVSLSSIEVCVMDEAHVLLAQNWQHVTAVLELLNKRPTDTTHGLSDLRRVYACALEGKSGRHRQTIVCSNFTNATLLSTFRAGRNNSGKVVLQHRSEAGVVARVAAPLLRQHFVRFSPRDVQSVDEERFAYFTEQLYASKIHPLIERGVRTILFVPSYFDFVRLRQYMHREHRESYAAISEYTPAKAQRRALGQFSDCERPLLLLTERFYFFRRYFVKLAEVMVFYSPPLFADFYVALLDRLVASSPNAFALTLYCRYDSHELNRIVGTARLQQMLQRESSIVSFVTS